jgi:hypothetical protein
MATNYTKGRAAEYRALKKLRDRGVRFCGRSAGSHGPFDIWWIEEKEQTVLIGADKDGRFELHDIAPPRPVLHLEQLKSGSAKPNKSERTTYSAFEDVCRDIRRVVFKWPKEKA